MRRCLTYLLLIGILAMAGSCQRRPLYIDDANVHISFVFDDDMPNVDAIQLPELMKVNFFQPSSASLAHSCYVKPEGGYANISLGTYHISSYNFDTEFTQIRNDIDIDSAEAYTNYMQADPMVDYNRLFRIIQEHRAEINASSRSVEDYSNQILVNQPDHLYTGWLSDENVNGQDDGYIYDIVIPVASIVKTYRLEISTITGMEHLYSADAYITGQAMAKRLHSQEVTGEPCSIHVELMGGKSRSADLSSLFNTFDRHPSTHAYVVLQLIDLGGNMQVYEWDVTDQFDDETNKERVIRIHTSITIEPPANETMQPVVNLWDENRYVINL